MVWVVGPLAMAGCLLLFFSLGWYDDQAIPRSGPSIGLVVYFLYGRRSSHMAPGNDAGADGPTLEPAPIFHEGPTGPVTGWHATHGTARATAPFSVCRHPAFAAPEHAAA